MVSYYINFLCTKYYGQCNIKWYWTLLATKLINYYFSKDSGNTFLLNIARAGYSPGVLTTKSAYTFE